MRTREEIENEVDKLVDKKFQTAIANIVFTQLEVLLDIRDLLSN